MTLLRRALAILLPLAWFAGCVGCSPAVRPPDTAECAAMASGEKSLVLLRLTGSMGGKVYALAAPGSVMYTTFAIESLDAPSHYKTAPNRSADRSALRDGWTFVLLPPGTYHLRDDWRGWRATGPGLTFVVPRGEPVVYAGTVRTALKSSWFTLGLAPDGAAAPVAVLDESTAAAAVAARMQLGSARVTTSLLRLPGSPAGPGVVEGASPFAITVSDAPPLTAPDWRARAFDKFRVPQDPRQAFAGAHGGGGDGRGALGAMLLYAIYLPFGSAMAAGQARQAEAKWAPCLESLGAELRELNVTARLRGKCPPAAATAGPGQLDLTVLRVCLRETRRGGTFCTEVAVRARLTDRTGRLRYDQTYLVSNPAGIADLEPRGPGWAPYEFPSPHEALVPPAMPVRRRDQFEGPPGRMAFRADVDTALDAIHHRVLDDLRPNPTRRTRTEKHTLHSGRETQLLPPGASSSSVVHAAAIALASMP